MDTIETTLYSAVLISALVIGTVLLYFAITMYRGRVKHFRILSKQLLGEMDVLERERTRIATDLHDDLGPQLAATKIQLEKFEPSKETDKQYHSTALKIVVNLTVLIGEIARNLTPKILLAKGLQTALEDFIEQFDDACSIKMELSYHVQSKLDPFYSLHIFRIVQELVHNAVKHSGANSLVIQLKEHQQKLYLFYTDDGKGLVAIKKEDPATGLGLVSMQNRAILLGGKMTHTITKKRGIDYVFEIPIPKINERADQTSDS